MEKIGTFCVDSGQAIIGDPCYIKSLNWRTEMDEGEEFNADLPAPYPYTYNGASSATCSDKRGGELGNGLAVAVQTGHGDGRYPVYVKRRHGVIEEVIIKFVEDDPSDYDTWSDDDDTDE